jgi:hypothetical protein
MNIQMRIITEDNIEQLENMTFSKNIDKLMFNKDTNIQEIIRHTQRNLRMNTSNNDVAPGSCEQVTAELTPEPSPQYPDTSPAYESENEFYLPNSTDSPPYNPFASSPENDFMGPRTPSMSPPRTPSMSPPPQEIEFAPQSPEEPPKFTGGEKVHYRGDKRPERLWTIRNLGDEFITIGTEDAMDLNPDDRIKVVESSDIYRQGDFAYPLINQQISASNSPMFPMKMNMQPSNMMPSGINFAPVIKINNGGTEYTNEDPSITPKISFENMESPVQNIEPEKGIVFKKDIQAQPPNTQEPKQTGGDNNTNGGLFSGIKDFIIKKLS